MSSEHTGLPGQRAGGSLAEGPWREAVMKPQPQEGGEGPGAQASEQVPPPPPRPQRAGAAPVAGGALLQPAGRGEVVPALVLPAQPRLGPDQVRAAVRRPWAPAAPAGWAEPLPASDSLPSLQGPLLLRIQPLPGLGASCKERGGWGPAFPGTVAGGAGWHRCQGLPPPSVSGWPRPRGGPECWHRL